MDQHSSQPPNGSPPRFTVAHGVVPEPPNAEAPHPAAIRRTPIIYRIADIVTEIVLYLLIVFTPWAFGTTQTWSIWTGTVAAYGLGALLLIKWVVRWKTGYQPARWTDAPANTPPSQAKPERAERQADALTRTLAVLTVILLAYCLVAAMNARATYYHSQMRFDFHDSFIPWLPHSYDSKSTWFAFWQYLGLAWAFWAARDWLLHDAATTRPDGMNKGEHSQAAFDGPRRLADVQNNRLPNRLRRLLWILCINGALAGIVAIIQRLDGTNKLLWLVTPRWNPDSDSFFGPYAYRSNAAQYFNIIWPVALGFWWSLREDFLRTHRKGTVAGTGSHILLLPIAVLLAACPMISSSRGGALIAAGNLVIATVLLTFAVRRRPRWIRLSILALFLAVLATGNALGWEKLQKRFETVFSDKLSFRGEIYENARGIARDFSIFGTGPGTFGSIYQLYRKNENQRWEAYAHDDWLETRATFGWVGFLFVVAVLVILASHWLVGRGIACDWVFLASLGLGLGGCLLHAKFDFPFQVYSLTFLFTLLSSVLFSLRKA